jgi:serine/threonine protein kinase
MVVCVCGPQEVMNIFVQLCLGLRHVHSHKILHRDLKVRARPQGCGSSRYACPPFFYAVLSLASVCCFEQAQNVFLTSSGESATAVCGSTHHTTPTQKAVLMRQPLLRMLPQAL